MKKTLYIVGTPPAPEGPSLLPSFSASRDSASVVLIQEGVLHQTLPVPRTFVLADDVKSRNVTSPFPSVSYQELIGMIFEADNVAVL
ncbi:MAG TPA: hypothetical protein VGA17_01750 [Nitrospiraceae bacterium]